MKMKATLAVLLGLAGLGLGDTCTGANVVTLPYENVTVLGSSIMRGVGLSMGTPPRTLAFELAGFANNTFLWEDSHGCGSLVGYDNPCNVNRGGIFWTNMSTSWSNTSSSNITATDTSSRLFDFTGKPPRGADVLHINDSYSLYDFPVATTGAQQSGMGMRLNSLGLGVDSTLLQTLVKTGAIVSKTWSLFYGHFGSNADSQMNGIVALGGFDQAKTQGDNMTFDVVFDGSCRTGLRTSFVTSINVGYENGTEDGVIQAPAFMCLDPSVPIMTFTDDILLKLKSKFGGTTFGNSSGIAPNGLLYPTKEAFTGNISITFNEKLKITIPNEQLVVPDRYVTNDRSAQLLFTDSSREILVGSSESSNPSTSMMYLGQPFFSAAYLMVNHDQQKFHVWQNKATDDEDYQAVTPDGTICKAPAPSSTHSSQATDNGSSGLSGGAIAGIVVGVVAFVVLAGLAAAFLLRRKKNVQNQNAANDYIKFSPLNENSPAKSPMSLAEAPGDSHQRPAEMPVDAHRAPVEAPGDSSHHVFELPGSGPESGHR